MSVSCHIHDIFDKDACLWMQGGQISGACCSVCSKIILSGDVICAAFRQHKVCTLMFTFFQASQPCLTRCAAERPEEKRKEAARKARTQS